ncbi:hypothetical protein [Levilactobacillus mulengensis]|uniref:hypothetical protein n=1 Tax=Levilactobacillus mulengensis TaxID=2486025 RepID=UPI000F782FC7|nr:hypothetical protein [Levilactobacillus mulengensis]
MISLAEVQTIWPEFRVSAVYEKLVTVSEKRGFDTVVYIFQAMSVLGAQQMADWSSDKLQQFVDSVTAISVGDAAEQPGVVADKVTVQVLAALLVFGVDTKRLKISDEELVALLFSLNLEDVGSLLDIQRMLGLPAENLPFSDDELPKGQPDKTETALLNDLAKVVAHPEQMVAVAKIYDPDPEEGYLQRHVKRIGTRKWQKHTARQVHRLAVRTGLQLWLSRQKYPLAPSATAGQTLEDVMSMIDAIYAKTLETPQAWSDLGWQDVYDWIQDDLDDEKVQQNLILTLTSTVHLLMDQGELNVPQATSISAILQGEFTAEKVKPPVRNRHSGGQGLSLAAAKKLRRKKRH